ncbi:polysaccharide biosynthesis protein [Clostridium sp. DL-VIII]|uniref:flippase n=1 Tax=Clostridium sp. DL-VIII TaxID=641107 RepID=UPI00023AFC89|nr:flippase [Clostridium sp. DL-VIII]EHI98326.1 polysaccharide biosynthesis protein [Clostridium sp. DL-VIII]
MGQLKKNITYNFVYQILILVVPFITAPYLSRKIGASGVGTYSFSQSIAMYFTYITTLGLSNYGNRVIASVQADRKERSRIFCEIYCMQMICFFVSVALYAIYIEFFSVDKVAAVIMVVWVISALFDINWFFFGMEQFKLTVIRNTAVKLLSVICIFIFVRTKNDVYIYILIMALCTIISQICLWPYVKKLVDIKMPSWHNVLSHFKPNFILFIPVIAVSIYKILDKIMLGYMCTMDEVGYYENAEKIINIVQSLIVAIGTVMLPRMTALFSSSDENTSKKYMDITMNAVMIYVSAASFGLFAIKDEFVIFYFGDNFQKTEPILGMLAITLLFFGCGNVLRTQYLIPKKKDQIYIKSAIVGAIVNILVNLLLIEKYGGLGAAVGTVCAEIIVCFYQFYKVRKEVNFVRYIPNALLFLSFGFIMLCVMHVLPTINSKILSLASDVFVGAIVYLTLVGIYIFIKRKYK